MVRNERDFTMGIEQANEALNNDLDSGKFDSSTESSSVQQDTKGQAPETRESQSSSIFDLDKAEKVMFQGQEWSLKDLKNAFLRQSDYTKKTQELAQERKFAENLSYDLESVFDNPELAEKFKEIYPEKYHAQLDRILQLRDRYNEQNQTSSQTNSGLDPQSIQKLIEKAVTSRVNPIIQDYTNKETAAIEAKLEALANKYSQTYDLADEEKVLSAAQALVDKGEKLTDQAWEKLWKDDHERTKKTFESYSKKQFEQQKQANAKSRDIAKGGGTPGQAPKRETFKEATERAIRELSGRG